MLDQLKQMIIPSQLLGEHENSHRVTLLDWIGTHVWVARYNIKFIPSLFLSHQDQSSTLNELAKECKSALEVNKLKHILFVCTSKR